MGNIVINPSAIVNLVIWVAGFLAALLFIVRPVRRTILEFREFYDDWKGRPGRPGFPRIPSMPERMASNESDMALIKKQVLPNGGTSIRDALARVEAQQRLTAVHQGTPIIEPAPAVVTVAVPSPTDWPVLNS